MVARTNREVEDTLVPCLEEALPPRVALQGARIDPLACGLRFPHELRGQQKPTWIHLTEPHPGLPAQPVS